MSKTSLLILLLSFLVVAALVGCGPQPSSVETPTPTPTPTPTASLPAPTQLTMLSITEGEVFIMKSGTDSWIEAQVGTTLESGDTIKAGDDSQAVITFFEGSTIELEAGTEIDVVALDVATDTGSTTILLEQVIGKTVSRVEKLADSASRYEVETPAAVAVVRGTTMIIDVAIEGGTIIGCQNGTAWGLAKDVGVKVQIDEGWQCSFEPGQLPGDLVPLSTPPDEDEDTGGRGRGRGTGGGGGSNGGGEQDITAIAITKTANTTETSAGHTITYTYEVTNPGDLPLSDISVTDDKVSLVSYQSGDSDRDERLDTNETWIFTASYTVGPDDPNPLVNTATAFGTGTSGKRVRAQASASVTILLQPGLNISKTGDEVSKAGNNVTYSFFIENTGDSALNRTSVHDTVLGDITSQFPAMLASGANATVNVTYTVDATDPDPLVNNVTAIYHVPGLGNLVSANSTHSVDLLHPGLNITKTSNCTTAYEGDEIIYTYNVTNTGDTPLSNISVIDDKAANPIYQNGDANGNNKLDVGETWIFSANYTASSNDTGLLVNIATANGTDALGETASAQASANVTILPYSIRIELTWVTNGTDIDAHFIRPGGAMWNITDDCCFHNMNPDWGLTGVGVDNPSLDQDVIDGYGPENTILRLPSEEGSYQYKVHYYTDFGHGGASTATVKIWINGIKVAEYIKELSNGDTWNCASIDWPSANVTPSSQWPPSSPPEVK